MFSNCGWIAKLAGALALLAWLCSHTHQSYSRLHPDVEWAALFSDRCGDRIIHIGDERVEGLDESGIRIGTHVGPVHVRTDARPPVGEYVSILARATGPRMLEAISIQINHGYAWKRPLNYAVSIFTVVAYLWAIRNRFRSTIRQGVLRGRY